MRFKICSHELFVELLCKDSRCLQKKPQNLPIHSLDSYRVKCALGTGAQQRPGVQSAPSPHVLMSCMALKKPCLWEPVSSSRTRRACCSQNDPPRSRRPSDLPDFHMRHLRMAPTPGMRYYSHQKPHSQQGYFLWLTPHQRLPKMV